MKTPREVLLGRHGPAQEDLDRIRRQVLANLPSETRPPVPASVSAPWWALLWEQVVVPARGAWAGLAAAWVLIAALHLLGGSTEALPFRPPADLTPTDLALLREQRQFCAELLEAGPVGAAATPQIPRPRSGTDPDRKSARRGGQEPGFDRARLARA
jgi:hypothetical protein